MNPYLIIVAGLVVVSAYGTGRYQGYAAEHEKFLTFQADVAAVGKAQELANQHAVQISEVISEGVKDEYETRIADLRRRYAHVDRMREPNTCGSNVPAVSKPTSVVAGSADDPAIVGLCAIETAKLIALQKWITKQQELSNAK